MRRAAIVLACLLGGLALALTGVAAGIYIWTAYTDNGTSTTALADALLEQLDDELIDQVVDEAGVREADVDVRHVTCVRTAAVRAACLAEADVEGEQRRYRYVVDIDRSTGNWISHAENGF